MSKNFVLGITVALSVALMPQLARATATGFDVPPESEKGTFSYTIENWSSVTVTQLQTDLNNLGSQGFHLLGPVYLSSVNSLGYYILRKNASLNQQFSYMVMETKNLLTLAQIQSLLATYGPQGCRIITYGQYADHLILEKVNGQGAATYSYEVVNLATDYATKMNEEGGKGFRYSYIYASNDTNYYTFFERSSISRTYHYTFVPANSKDFQQLMTEFNTYGGKGYRCLYQFSLGTGFSSGTPWDTTVMYEHSTKGFNLKYSSSAADNSPTGTESLTKVLAAWNSAGSKGKQGIDIGDIGTNTFQNVNLFELAQ